MSENERCTGGSERWASEEEFLDWIDDYCDYVVGIGEQNTSTHDISNALKMRGIQNDLESGEISFQDALDRYERELVTDTDQ